MDIKTYMQTVGRQARSASRSVAAASTDAKNKALLAMAAEIRARATQLLDANARDLAEARANGLEPSMIDRLTLSAKGIEAMAVADRLVVLNELGLRELPVAMRAKGRLVLQSCSARRTLAKTPRHLRVLMVGHLRDEKCPQLLWQAAQALSEGEGIYIDHIGKALDPALAEEALQVASQCKHYRWLGELPHAQTRRSIQRAHVLVHPSRLEGGAHVIMEAMLSGTPVLASHVSGNVGMLGVNYPGYFEPGNATQLVTLLRQCKQSQTQADGLLAHLTHACHARAPLFQPEREQASLRALVSSALHPL